VTPSIGMKSQARSIGAVQFPVDGPTFRALPRHPDWAYEHIDGCAHLRYRPRPLDLVRDLSPVPPRTGDAEVRHGLVVQPATEADEEDLIRLVALVWDGVDPYRYLRALADPVTEAPVAASAGPRFARTLAGDDDPWDPPVLVARARAGAGPVTGVVALSTWRPAGEGTSPVAVAITWLTVSPRWRRAGVGTELLAAAVEVARCSGSHELHSAVSAANLPSICWHWVNGFQPLPRVG
jgi:GNAT superfamily N-acetyltransferase